MELYLVSERKLGIFSKIKEDENYNHRNTLRHFEDYNLSLTQRLGKITVFGRALVINRGKVTPIDLISQPIKLSSRLPICIFVRWKEFTLTLLEKAVE